MGTQEVVDRIKAFISEALAREMREQNLSQRALAERIGVSDPVLGAWLKRESLPERESLIKIAHYFGWTMTPFYEMGQGKDDHRRMQEERLSYLLSKVPDDFREELTCDLEARLESWLRRHGKPIRGAP